LYVKDQEFRIIRFEFDLITLFYFLDNNAGHQGKRQKTELVHRRGTEYSLENSCKF